MAHSKTTVRRKNKRDLPGDLNPDFCRGERHLSAVIGSNEYRKEYCNKIVRKWTNELKLLSEIALIHLQSACASYVSGFQHRYNY